MIQMMLYFCKAMPALSPKSAVPLLLPNERHTVLACMMIKNFSYRKFSALAQHVCIQWRVINALD